MGIESDGYQGDRKQLTMKEFFSRLVGVRRDNRWIRLTAIMPWEYIKKVYIKDRNRDAGRPDCIRHHLHQRVLLSNRRVYRAGNAGKQLYAIFMGPHKFRAEPLFDPSIMAHFRKRFPVEAGAKINEYVCTEKWPEA